MAVSAKLYRRGRYWWVRICASGKETRRSLGTRSRQRAEAMVRELVERMDAGEARQGEDQTVRAYATRRMEAWSRRLRETTLHGYRIGIAEGLEVIGRQRLASIKRADAIRVAERLRLSPNGKERSVSTLKGRLAPWGALFSDAVDEELVRSNPFALRARLIRHVAQGDHEAPKELEFDRDPIPYTRDEQERLLAVVGDPEDRVAILMGLRSGLRRSEVLALRRGDVDVDQRVLRVVQRLAMGTIEKPKSQAGRRIVPVSRDLAAAIRKLISDQNRAALRIGSRPSDLLFPAKRKRTPTTYAQEENQFGRRFARYLEAAEIPRKVRHPFHRLRHTFASELLARGVPVHPVSRWLGHATSKVTEEVYAHWIPNDEERRAIDSLDQAPHNPAQFTAHSDFRPEEPES